MQLTPPPRILWLPIVQAALREDLGRAGDLSTEAIIPADLRANGVLMARAPGRIATLRVDGAT